MGIMTTKNGPIMDNKLSNIPSEQSVIGACLLSSVAIERCEHLKAEDFSRHDHVLIFRAILELNEKRITPDVTTVSDKLG